MNERLSPENAFGLRWIQDDDQGRLVAGAGGSEYRNAADAIRSLGLGIEEAALTSSLDRFPPRLRIHGGYRVGIGEAAVRFSLTWEPGAAEAVYVQSKDSPEEGMTGTIDMSPEVSLNDSLKGLLVPDAEDVISEANDHGRALKLREVDFWIGVQHFNVSGEEQT